MFWLKKKKKKAPDLRLSMDTVSARITINPNKAHIPKIIFLVFLHLRTSLVLLAAITLVRPFQWVAIRYFLMQNAKRWQKRIPKINYLIWSYAFCIIYSRLSLSRLHISRITAYLEVKIWPLFKHNNLTKGKISWKRGEIASKEQFLIFFPQYF